MAPTTASTNTTSFLEKHLKCSICLETFEDPITTACGHSFCKKCLECNFEFNDRVCPLCKTPIFRNLEVNIILRDIIQQQREELRISKDLEVKDDEVACDVCTKQKLKAVKSCLVCLASYCSTHVENHSSTERLKGHKLVAPVVNLNERACLKHGRALELYSRKQQMCICVQCTEGGLEEVVSTEEEWQKKKVKIEENKMDLKARIKNREQQLDKLRTCVKNCKDKLEDECEDIESVFNSVLAIVEEARTRALQPLRDRTQTIEKEANYQMQMLEAEIVRFNTTVSELDDIASLDDHIQFLQKYPPLQELKNIKEWAEVELDTSLSFGTMRKNTTIMMENVKKAMDKLTSIELKRASTFAVDVTLDPTTAHHRLVLSDDGKEVKDGEEDQEVEDTPGRFDLFGSILGTNSLTSGRSYWEVEVNKKPGWDLGVARAVANRKGTLSLSPEKGYWVAVHYEGHKYAALVGPPLRLCLPERPQKVGVFVDYDEGLVSFYDVTNQSHIYSFTECSFKGELLPYFSPHVRQGDTNAEPLVISPVKQCKQNTQDADLEIN